MWGSCGAKVRWPLPVLVLVGILAAACGGTATAPAPQPAGSQSAAPAPAPAAKVETVAIAVPSTSLTFSPLYIGNAQGLFAKEGLTLKLVQLAGGNATVAALRSGDVQMAIQNGGSMIQAAAQGVTDIVSVGSMVHVDAMEFTVSKSLEAKVRALAGAPVAERLKLLKGLKIGIDAPGGAADQITRLAAKTAGLDPTKDIQEIAVGVGPALDAALKSGQIDAITYTPPTPELAVQGGYGIHLAAGAELPGMDQMEFDAIAVHKSLIQQNPELILRTLKVIAAGIDFLRSQPDQAVAILKQHEMSTVAPEIIAAGLKVYANGWQPGLTTAPAVWDNAAKLLVDGGAMKSVNVNLQDLWTGQFTKQLAGS